jgi:hypothetical protein
MKKFLLTTVVALASCTIGTVSFGQSAPTPEDQVTANFAAAILTYDKYCGPASVGNRKYAEDAMKRLDRKVLESSIAKVEEAVRARPRGYWCSAVRISMEIGGGTPPPPDRPSPRNEVTQGSPSIREQAATYAQQMGSAMRIIAEGSNGLASCYDLAICERSLNNLIH